MAKQFWDRMKRREGKEVKPDALFTSFCPAKAICNLSYALQTSVRPSRRRSRVRCAIASRVCYWSSDGSVPSLTSRYAAHSKHSKHKPARSLSKRAKMPRKLQQSECVVMIVETRRTRSRRSCSWRARQFPSGQWEALGSVVELASLNSIRCDIRTRRPFRDADLRRRWPVLSEAA